MPRNMSFSLTTEQFRKRTKTVTRRLGWRFLKVGDVVNGCVKCMGLQPGEKIERLGQIRIRSVRREPLSAMTSDLEYGRRETTAEGFPDGHTKHDPAEFVKMFCAAINCSTDREVTRIEFEYIDH